MTLQEHMDELEQALEANDKLVQELEKENAELKKEIEEMGCELRNIARKSDLQRLPT